MRKIINPITRIVCLSSINQYYFKKSDIEGFYGEILGLKKRHSTRNALGPIQWVFERKKG
jgi:hypothetical protein